MKLMKNCDNFSFLWAEVLDEVPRPRNAQLAEDVPRWYAKVTLIEHRTHSEHKSGVLTILVLCIIMMCVYGMAWYCMIYAEVTLIKQGGILMTVFKRSAQIGSNLAYRSRQDHRPLS